MSFDVLQTINLAYNLQTGKASIPNRCDLRKCLKNLKILKDTTQGHASPSIVISGELVYLDLERKSTLGEPRVERSPSEQVPKENKSSLGLPRVESKRGVHNTKPVVLKMSFKTNPQLDNSFALEGRYYDCIVRQLLHNHYTPNLVGVVDVYECDQMTTKRYTAALAKLGKIISRIEYSDPLTQWLTPVDVSQALFVLLEKVNDPIDLVDWVQLPSITKREYLQVMFMVMYNLVVFDLIKFRHNDLHGGNIIIQTLSKPKTLLYFLTETTYYQITTRFIPKIFDYDNAYLDGSVKNIVLDEQSCIYYAECNRYNPKNDLFRVLESLWRVKRPSLPISSQFPLACTDGSDTLFRMPKNIMGTLCKSNPEILEVYEEVKRNSKIDWYNEPSPPLIKCDGDWIPSDQILKSPTQVLGLKWFREFRRE